MSDRRDLLKKFKAPMRPSNDQLAMADRREKIALGAVNSGRDPRGDYTDEALAELFDADELKQLIEAAEAEQAQRQKRQEAADRREDIRAMVAVIEREREAARRAEIETEARRRLKLEE